MGHNQVNTYAAFVNADWQVLSNLSLTGGARYTYQYRDYLGCLFDPERAILPPLWPPPPPS
jgi:outer membrane receptor protein involved in Fe transport